VSAGALTAVSQYGGAAGNDTLGIFALATVSGSASTTSNTYTYSTNTTAAGTVFTASIGQCEAVGNATVGIFARANSGGYTTTTYTYTYSGATVGAGRRFERHTKYIYVLDWKFNSGYICGDKCRGDKCI